MPNKEKIKDLRLKLNSTLYLAELLRNEIETLKTNSPEIHNEIKHITDKLNKNLKRTDFNRAMKKGNTIVVYFKKPVKTGTYRDRDSVPTSYGIPEFHTGVRFELNKAFGKNFIKSGKPFQNGKGFILEVSQEYLKSKDLV
jgi:hypothetical protein